MTLQDFIQLSAAIQREFTIHACVKLITMGIDTETSIDLFYACNGNFFIELYTNREQNLVLHIKSFNFNHQALEKYLMGINISVAYNILNGTR